MLYNCNVWSDLSHSQNDSDENEPAHSSPGSQRSKEWSHSTQENSRGKNPFPSKFFRQQSSNDLSCNISVQVWAEDDALLLWIPVKFTLLFWSILSNWIKNKKVLFCFSWSNGFVFLSIIFFKFLLTLCVASKGHCVPMPAFSPGRKITDSQIFLIKIYFSTFQVLYVTAKAQKNVVVKMKFCFSF